MSNFLKLSFKLIFVNLLLNLLRELFAELKFLIDFITSFDSDNLSKFLRGRNLFFSNVEIF